MSKYGIFLLLVTTGVVQAQPLCTSAWYQSIDNVLNTSDGQGHGPDVGSDEWKSVIEFKLGVHGETKALERGSPDWCRYIDRRIHAMHLTEGRAGKSSTARPSFDCAKVKAGSIEAKICEDQELSALDLKLSEVYAAASRNAGDKYLPRLRAEQRGWIKGRDQCWKADDQNACLLSAYTQRTVELQVGYALVEHDGPIHFDCGEKGQIDVSFFKTDPPAVAATYRDQHSIMIAVPSGSGRHYQGQNESFWEHQGQATVIWGADNKAFTCKNEVNRPGALPSKRVDANTNSSHQ